MEERKAVKLKQIGYFVGPLLYCTKNASFLLGNEGRISPWKASCDGVALPKLTDLLTFSRTTKGFG